MTNREFYLTRRKTEWPTFVKVVRAVPQGRLDFRPDPKARSAGQLAWFLATSEAALVSLLEKGTVLWKEGAPPSGIDEIVAAFERSGTIVNERLERLDEAGWEKKGSFVMEGAPAWEDTIGQFFWGFLFDGVHHRGQLTTYLRPMGGKVPAIYGASADDTGQ